MDISSIIKRYRSTHRISLRDFAAKCGTSHSYISMLESGKNSKTGEPIVPSLIMLKKIAKGLDISIDELIDACDDIPITLSDEKEKSPSQNDELSESIKMLIELFERIPVENQPMVLEMIRAALKAQGLL